MTQAQQLLKSGLAVLQSEHGEPFRIEGITRDFRLISDGTRVSDDLGLGGFAMSANGILCVARSELESAGIVPKLGMRIIFRDRVWIVNDIDTIPLRWLLAVTVGHPKETGVTTSDVIIVRPRRNTI